MVDDRSETPSPGSEITPREDTLISDVDILRVLRQMGRIVGAAERDERTFLWELANNRLDTAVPLMTEELELWNQLFGISQRTLDQAEMGKLFVPDFTPDTRKLLTLASNKPGTQLATNSSEPLGTFGSGQPFRINLDERVSAPIKPLDPEELRFIIKPHASINARTLTNLGASHDDLRAVGLTVVLTIHVQDKLGRWVLKHIPGTGNLNDRDRVYAPYVPASAGLTWSQVEKIHKRPDDLEVVGDKPDLFSLFAHVAESSDLSGLTIPTGERTRFFFWQLDRFINPGQYNIGTSRQPLLPVEK